MFVTYYRMSHHRTTLHLPFELTYRHPRGILADPGDRVKLVDLYSARQPLDDSGFEETIPLFDCGSKDLANFLSPRGDDFQPRVYFDGNSPTIIAIDTEGVSIYNMERLDIVGQTRPFGLSDPKPIKVAEQWNTFPQNIPLIFSSKGGLYYSLIDPRESKQTCSSSILTLRPAEAFDVGRIDTSNYGVGITESSRLSTVKEGIVRQYSYCQTYKKANAQITLNARGLGPAVDLKSSFNGWLNLITYRSEIFLVDFRSKEILADTPTPRNFAKQRSSLQNTSLKASDLKIFGISSFIKCDFEDPTDSEPRHFLIVSVLHDGTMRLLRVNIRAFLSQKSNAITNTVTILPGKLSTQSNLTQIQIWKNGVWLLPKDGAISHPQLAFYRKSDDVGVSDKEDPDAPSGVEHERYHLGNSINSELPVGESSFGKSTTAESPPTKPIIYSLECARELLANRNLEEDRLQPLLSYFATRMQKVLPKSILDPGSFTARDDILDYCQKWTQSFNLDSDLIEAFDSKDTFKLIGGSCVINVKLRDTISFQKPALGCLAFALRFLSQERKTAGFIRLMSMLLGECKDIPLILHVFCTSSTPGVYLPDLEVKQRCLSTPKRQRSMSDQATRICVAAVDDSASREFVRKRFPIPSPEDLLAAHKWSFESNPSDLPKELDIFVPRSKQNSTWWDNSGSFKSSALGKASIAYPICVPSRSIDERWRVDTWGFLQDHETCLVLFIRPSLFQQMAERLGDKAVFVIIPLEPEGDAYAFTREIIRQWAQYFKCDYIFCLDDNIELIETIDRTRFHPLRSDRWINVFQMFSMHAQASESSKVAVWGMRRRNHLSDGTPSEDGWRHAHCQCFILLNISLLAKNGIRYRWKDSADVEDQKRLGDGAKMGPMEDYLLNFECERKKLLVLQNQFYVYTKVPSRSQQKPGQGRSSGRSRRSDSKVPQAQIG